MFARKPYTITGSQDDSVVQVTQHRSEVCTGTLKMKPRQENR